NGGSSTAASDTAWDRSILFERQFRDESVIPLVLGKKRYVRFDGSCRNQSVCNEKSVAQAVLLDQPYGCTGHLRIKWDDEEMAEKSFDLALLALVPAAN